MGTSDTSPTVYGSFGDRPPGPEGLQATLGAYETSIRLEWNATPDALVYHIMRAPAEDGPFAGIGSTTSDLSFVDQGLPPGQEFWYKVKASNPCGCSGDRGAVKGTTSLE